MEDLALVVHLVGVVGFFAGIVTAAIALSTARRADDVREVAAVLGVARRAIPVVGIGTALLLTGGIWLTTLEDVEERSWFAASLGLFVAATWLGAMGGRTPKEARLAAERARDEGTTAVGPDLRALLDDRRAFVLNVASTACALAVLVLMVVQPGG